MHHPRSRPLIVVLGALLALSCSVAAAHAQATIADCEKIQAADAYNQCLAKFGPPAKTGNLEPERPGDVKASPAEAAASGGKAARGRGHASGRRHGRGHTIVRRGRGGGRVARGGGRKRMTISVGK